MQGQLDERSEIRGCGLIPHIAARTRCF